jgi:hypothetical protein
MLAAQEVRLSRVEHARVGTRLPFHAQASIYSAWRHSAERAPPLWQRLPMWVLSKIPLKQDELLVRIRTPRS